MLSAKETANLFRASCVALIATAMCFGVRADVMDAQAGMFQFSREQIGWIAGAAFWGFTIAMFVGGQICDLLGMRLMIALGFVGHVLGILMSACAGRFWTLYAGTLAIGMANGVIEAALNPLAATLYPERKTERLNALHVWFPGGIVLGGLMSLALTHLGCGWRFKTAFLIVPVLIYGMMFRRLSLPPTERAQSLVPARDMYLEALRPGFLVLLFCIVLTASTELGPNQWIPSILSRTAHLPGILVLVWITGLMAVGRHYARQTRELDSADHVAALLSLVVGIGIGGVGDRGARLAGVCGCHRVCPGRLLPLADDVWHHLGAPSRRRRIPAGADRKRRHAERCLCGAAHRPGVRPLGSRDGFAHRGAFALCGRRDIRRCVVE